MTEITETQHASSEDKINGEHQSLSEQEIYGKPHVKKCIISQEHLATFLSSPTHDDLMSFLEALNRATIGVKLRDDIKDSQIVTVLHNILNQVEQIALETPAVENPNSRFGNPAFKTFYDKVKQKTPSLLEQIPNLEKNQISTLSVYFYESWGNRTRIDYGSGMELNFFCFLLALSKLGLIKNEDLTALSIHVFWKYIQVMRVLQSNYWLEPAGSHGVWGLDDYHFIPFILGSAQLCGHKHLRPTSIHDKEIVEEFSKDYMYFACIGFVNSIKTASLQWHSPMLNDISAVKNWEKINSGLIKMFRGEVLSKLPVVQHFLFSPLLPFPGVDDYETDDIDAYPQDGFSESHNHNHTHGGIDLDTGTREHPHPAPDDGHGHSIDNGPPDCCGIPVPSAFGEARAKQTGALREVLPGVPVRVPGNARRIPFD